MALIWRKPKTPQENTRWKNFALSWKNKFARISQHSKRIMRTNPLLHKMGHYFNEEGQGTVSLEPSVLNRETKNAIQNVRYLRSSRNLVAGAGLVLGAGVPPHDIIPYALSVSAILVQHQVLVWYATKGSLKHKIVGFGPFKSDPVEPSQKFLVNWPEKKAAYQYAIVPYARFGFSNPFGTQTARIILTNREEGLFRPYRIRIRSPPPKEEKERTGILGKFLKPQE